MSEFSTSRKGKSEEASFKKMLDKAKCFVYRVPDHASGLKRKAAADFLAVKSGNSYMFEVKRVSGKAFNFSTLKDHQAVALRQHVEKGGGLSFIVLFYGKEVLLLHIDDYMHMRDTTELKSVSFDALREVATIAEKFFKEEFV